MAVEDRKKLLKKPGIYGYDCTYKYALWEGNIKDVVSCHHFLFPEKKGKYNFKIYLQKHLAQRNLWSTRDPKISSKDRRGGNPTDMDRMEFSLSPVLRCDIETADLSSRFVEKCLPVLQTIMNIVTVVDLDKKKMQSERDGGIKLVNYRRNGNI